MDVSVDRRCDLVERVVEESTRGMNCREIQRKIDMRNICVNFGFLFDIIQFREVNFVARYLITFVIYYCHLLCMYVYMYLVLHFL